MVCMIRRPEVDIQEIYFVETCYVARAWGGLWTMLMKKSGPLVPMKPVAKLL